ncbi:putative transposase [Shigella flexneri CCH060]|uniref:Putative transposase n=1 Tax=Shigella flexneri CCH060 TaxID=754091 RepID=A0A6N3R7X3_SHIFL|nr:putative transposase [Shigella flexneri CCH060]
MSRQCTHYGRWPQHGFTSLKKLRPQSVTSRIQPGSDVIVCAEMDEQWGYVGAKSRQRWLFYAYDRIRRTVVAHVFGERTLATLERLLSLLSAFEVVVWMTDGWPLYESRLKGKLHVISKRYTQRIERHNLNLRQHLARLGRKSLSFSKSVELHDKVIGLNRPGFPGECFICELRLPDHRFRWKHNKLFLLLPEGCGPAFPAIVDYYTSPPT